MPNFSRLIQESDFKQMDSVIPPVSSVAWASFMTGSHPGKHGIYGFVERDPDTMKWFIPLADRLKIKTIQTHLSSLGKRVFMMNVPLTYPSPTINGISICGFLGSDITTGTYPPAIGTLLRARGYIIDADTSLAKSDLNKFYNHLIEVLEKRIDTMWHFWNQEPWDFFMTHIMETDRLHHFFWEYMETGHSVWREKFYQFYNRIDKLLGEIILSIPEEIPLMLLSDHGFTSLKKEVYLNKWLTDNGYLKFHKQFPETLQDLHPSAKAYSLYPGRIYINLKGRERNGFAEPGLPYENIRQELKQKLLNFTYPESQSKIIKEVYFGEQLYGAYKTENQFIQSGFINPANFPYPDLVAIANNGYDLKGNLWRGHIFEKTVFNGMHTSDDAFILLRNGKLPESRFSIADVSSIINNILKVDNLNSVTEI